MTEIIDPERLWRGWQKHTPFESVVRMELESWDKAAGTARFRLPFAPEYRRSDKAPGHHGGVIATFVDVAGDFAVAIKCDTGGVPTINIRIDYLKPAVGDALVAVARVRRAGRTVTVVDIDVFNDKDQPVAIGRGTYASVAG